jgi:predicted nucleic acid-binding protein
MKINKVITYSLLAQIRNTGNLVNSSIDIFVPIVKYALYRFITEECQYKGESTNELREWILNNFGLPFPNPILTQILLKIGQEINTEDEVRLMLYKDGGFWIKNYQFEEFNEAIEQNRQNVAFVQKCFEDFCQIYGLDYSGNTSIFDFIDSNKERLGRYLGNKSKDHSQNYAVEAQFVEFFKKIPGAFSSVRQIYLGSILSCYLEYELDNSENNSNVELVFDTNFIVSLLDLNTPESTHTCRELLKVASKFGYSFRVLNITLEETYGLLMKYAENFDSTFLAKLVNPEDIYNACIRRQLNRIDLEKIADSLERTLSDDFGITPIPYTEKYQNLARHSNEYSELKRYRNTDFAALHDITAKIYVKDKRGNKRVKNFEDVKCWFVNNAFNRDLKLDSFEYRAQDGFQPEIIRADVLLNILWFAKPDLINSLEDDVIESGLNSLISCTLNSDLPHPAIIKELDENIQKYQQDGCISDSDIIRVATRISNNELHNNIEELNHLAQKDSQKFIATIKEESEKQEREEQERIQRFESLLAKLEQAAVDVPNPVDLDAEKIKRLHAINEVRQMKRKEVTDKALAKWRKGTWVWFIIVSVLLIGSIVAIILLMKIDISKLTWIFPAVAFVAEFFIGKCLYSQYYDQTNIAAFESRIIIPNNLKELNDISQLPD